MEYVNSYCHSCLLLRFPCMKSCLHILIRSNTQTCFLAQALAFILLSTTRPGNDSQAWVAEGVCYIIGVCLNVKNVCICLGWWGVDVTEDVDAIFPNAWNQLTEGENYTFFLFCAAVHGDICKKDSIWSNPVHGHMKWCVSDIFSQSWIIIPVIMQEWWFEVFHQAARMTFSI